MKYIMLVLSFCLFSFSGFSQELDFMIHSTFGKPVLKEQLIGAKSMKDINPDYPSSWIEDSDYVSSEISAICGGVDMKAAGENDRLNTTQQNVLKNADLGTAVSIEVKYKVKNSITKKIEIKSMKFSVSLVPETEATFIGGVDKLNQYLKNASLEQINKTDAKKFNVANVKFFINEDGKAIDIKLLDSSGNEQIDQILLSTISNMPKWNPAKDANSQAVKQEFMFSIGTTIGC